MTGTTLGFKNTSIFKLNRKGSLNPMFGKKFSPEFVAMPHQSSFNFVGSDQRCHLTSLNVQRTRGWWR